MDRSKALAALSALAHETRLDLIRLLMPAGCQGLAAGQIAQALGIAAPRLSFHLAALEQAGLLTSRKAARNVFYAVDPSGIGRTVGYLLNDCCCENPEVIAACSCEIGRNRARDPQSAENQGVTAFGIAKT